MTSCVFIERVGPMRGPPCGSSTDGGMGALRCGLGCCSLVSCSAVSSFAVGVILTGRCLVAGTE